MNEKSQDNIERLEKVRWKCRTDLFFLAREILGYRDVDMDVHFPLLNILQKFPQPPLNRLSEYDLITPTRCEYLKPFCELTSLPGGRRRLILDPRGFYKCHRINNLSGLSNGEYRKVSDLSVGDELRATSEENSLVQGKTRIVAIEKQPPQDCYTVKLRSGRKLEVSGNHPVRLIEGFVEAKDLVVGDRPAILGNTPEPENAPYEPTSEIVGWFLGDGSISNQSVSNNNPIFRQYIIEASERAGGTGHSCIQKERSNHYVRCQGLRPLFRELCLDGKTSGNKFIPQRYFRANNESLKELLFGLYMSDGCCTHTGIILNTKSELMAHDIQRALLRFNVYSTVYPYKLSTGPYAGNEYFRVSVTSQKHIKRFMDAIGWEKQATFDFSDKKSNANTDTVPKGWRSRFGKYIFGRGELPESLKRPSGKGISTRKYDITKERLSLYAEALENEELRLMSSDEIYWDEVTDVIYDGKHETIAIQTESGTIAIDDIITHNTTLNVVCHTVQWILNYPDIAILIVHARQETAEDMMSEIRSHFMYNQKMREIFPEYCLSPKNAGSRGRFTVPNRKRKARREPTVASCSLDSSVAGYHYDVIKFTDIVDATNTGTREQCKKTIQNFGNFRNILVAPNYWIDVEGTCYDFSDLYNETIDNQCKMKVEDRRWQIHVRGCYKKDTGGKPYTFLPEERELRDLLDSSGNKISWFPKKFPVHELESMRKDPTLGETLFAAQQLNNPKDTSDDKAFPLSQFRSKSHSDLQKVPMSYYMSTVDSAETVNKGSDYSAIVTCGYDQAGRCYVVDVRHGKFLPDQLIKEIFEVNKRWRPRSIRVEETGYIRGLKPSIRRHEDQIGMYLPFVFSKADNQRSKEERIRLTLQPWYKRGEIFFDESLPSLDHVKTELTSFPKGRTDDIIDALADQFQDREWLGRETDRGIATGEQFQQTWKEDQEEYAKKLVILMKAAQDRKVNGSGEYNQGGYFGSEPGNFFDSTGGL